MTFEGVVARLPRPLRVMAWAGWRWGEHEQGVIAGHMAYSFMLSMLPFLIFATALTGWLIGTEGTAAALEILFDIMPEHVAKTLQPAVIEVTSRPRTDILGIAAIGTLWAASNAVEAMRAGLNRAYEYDIERGVVVDRLIAIGLTLLGFIVFVGLSGLIIFAPLAVNLIYEHVNVVVPKAATITRYAISFAMLCWFVWLMHRVLPARRMKGFLLWPGIVVSVALWIAVATGLSVYLANVRDYAITYGTLAGVIITLLFLYLTGAALMLGAEINAVVNAKLMRPPDLSPEGLAREQAELRGEIPVREEV